MIPQDVKNNNRIICNKLLEGMENLPVIRYNGRDMGLRADQDNSSIQNRSEHMAIRYNESSRSFQLDTPSASYVIGVVDAEGFVGHAYYGK